MHVVKKCSFKLLVWGKKVRAFPPSWQCLGSARPTSLCVVLQVDADRYALTLFVTGDDLGQTRETVAGLPVRGINEFCCQLIGRMPSHLERVLHEG